MKAIASLQDVLSSFISKVNKFRNKLRPYMQTLANKIGESAPMDDLREAARVSNISRVESL